MIFMVVSLSPAFALCQVLQELVEPPFPVTDAPREVQNVPCFRAIDGNEHREAGGLGQGHTGVERLEGPHLAGARVDGRSVLQEPC